jgi:hypothetical protein
MSLFLLYYSDLGRLLVTTISPTTVVFEIIGQLVTWFALLRDGGIELVLIFK